MKIAKFFNSQTKNDIWMTGRRIVLLKDKSIVEVNDLVLGCSVWDDDGSYIGECIELIDVSIIESERLVK